MQTEPFGEVVHEQLDRLGQSRQFARSRRLRRFLRFTVERALEGRPDTLTEHGIGVAVYDRPADFDQSIDGIVRVEAHRLRAKLSQYYRGQGRQDPLIIEYPAGSYVPLFRSKDSGFLPSHGKMAQLITSLDWGRTPLGAIVAWPRHLKIALAACLRTGFPQAIYWGREWLTLYNDPMAELIGTELLGKSGLAEPGTLHETAENGNAASASMIPDERHLIGREGFREERYFTSSYSPILDAVWKPAGVLLTMFETTARVIGDRHSKTMNDLSLRGAPPTSAPDACRFAASVLQLNPFDIPFALIYLLNGDRRGAMLQGSSGVEPGTAVSPRSINFSADNVSLLAQAASHTATTGGNQILQVADRLGSLPSGAWAVSPAEVAVLPITVPGQTLPDGVLIAGVNPHRRLDPDYRTFFESISTRIGELIVYARFQDQEKRQTEARKQTEMDRIAFLRNAGEEFRTPLTVLLGSLNHLQSDGHLEPKKQAMLKTAQRSGLRILKLANGLIALTRLQAGEVRLTLESLDLSALTSELAKGFRKAVEAAGLRLIVDCPPLPCALQVDRRMWEEIVLNLLLNAFTNTEHGEVGLALRPVGAWIELAVWDTGVGVPSSELTHIFEPFHREQPRANSQAKGRPPGGAGIGLALVRKLAEMHGGNIAVESEEGKGSKFVVTIPRRDSQVTPESEAEGATPSRTAALTLGGYLEEALAWSAEQAEWSEEWSQRTLVARSSGRVLIATPDEDLRGYLSAVLGEIHGVTTTGDFESVVSMCREKKVDLLLADAAIDRAKLCALIREIRASADLRSLPVLVISGSDSEEDRVRLLACGADDYIVKPFATRELLLRVQSQIEIRRRTGDDEKRLRTELAVEQAMLGATLDQVPAGAMIAAIPSGAILQTNAKLEQILGVKLPKFSSVDDYPQAAIQRLDGRPYELDEYPLVRAVRFGEVVTEEELIYPRSDGAGVKLVANTSHVSDRDGNIVAAILTLRKAE